MIEIKKTGSSVQFVIDTGVGYNISPTWNTGDALYATLLEVQLNKRLDNLIERIRQEAYNKGWSDKSKHARKKTNFFDELKTGGGVGY